MIQMFLNMPILQKIGFLVGIFVIGILLMKYRNQVITFLKCVGAKIHKLIGFIFGTVSNLMGKAFNYFKNKKLLLAVILTNIFAVSFSVYATMSGKNTPWNIVIGCFFCSVVFVPAFYTKEYIAWLSRGNSLVKRAISKLWDCYIYFTPLISFAVSWHLSELYFRDTLAGYEIPILIVLVAMGILWIINYCVELLDINKTAYGMKHRVTLF